MIGLLFQAILSMAYSGKAQDLDCLENQWMPEDMIYNPGQDCEYDGSRVPNCSAFIQPGTGEPYYHLHEYDCSKFWECGPNGETCMFQCAPCGDMCPDYNGLSFDCRYQYPLGPVCDFPANVDCEGVCNISAHCPDGDSDALCDVPTYGACQYCDNSSHFCEQGCDDDINCPSDYPVCNPSHQCGCSMSGDCDGSGEVCNVQTYSNCFYCDASNSQCKPGCDADSNCPVDFPVCGDDHRCSCTENSDCEGNDAVCDIENDPYLQCSYCDITSSQCKPGCIEDSNCPLYHICDEFNTCVFVGECDEERPCMDDNVLCNPEYSNCYYCDLGTKTCEPGCETDSECKGFGSNFLCSGHTCLNPGTGLTVIVHDDHNRPISGATAKVTKGGITTDFGSTAGIIEIPIYSLGTYQVSIEAAGYITSDFSVKFTEFVPMEKLVILYPISDKGKTKITLTWDGSVYDLDPHVMDIPKDGSTICRTWYSNENGCPSISLDWDNTGTGLAGPEIISLNNPNVNQHSVYAVAVMHYRGGSSATPFLTCGATVTVSDGTSTHIEKLVDPGYPVSHPNDWWFVGCVKVDSRGLFTFTRPRYTTFFDGSDSGFTSLKRTHC